MKNRRMYRLLILTYLVLFHLFMLFVLIQTEFLQRAARKLGWLQPSLPPEPSDYVATTMLCLGWLDAQVPDGSVLFIGDSIVQSLCVSAVADHAVNFGIGGDTTLGVLTRLRQYRSVSRARAVVIAIGVNDLMRRPNGEILDNYREILGAVPGHVPLVWNAVLPIDETGRADFTGYNQRIRALNAAMKGACASRIGCHFLDVGAALSDPAGNLASAYHVGDNLHLSPRGYTIWMAGLKETLAVVFRGPVPVIDPPP